MFNFAKKKFMQNTDTRGTGLAYLIIKKGQYIPKGAIHKLRWPDFYDFLPSPSLSKAVYISLYIIRRQIANLPPPPGLST